MSNGPVIGIDLGTTNSVVAVADQPGGRILAGSDGLKLIPSVVSFHPSGDVLVGASAKERRLLDAQNTVYSVKRLIGRPYTSYEVKQAQERFPFELSEGPSGGVLVTARGETYTLSEISAFVLRHVRKVAEESLGKECSQAVVTVPANFNELQRSATKAAGRVAGLDVLRILNEPTAAALAYGYNKTSTERVAVYDLGGGTFDITILQLAGDVFEVLATAGDTFLGGDDVDTAVADHMAAQFLEQNRYDARQDRQAYERLRAAAEWAKIQLSTKPDVKLCIEELAYGDGGVGLNLDYALTRQQIEHMCQPLVARSFDVCEDAMKAAGLRPTQLDNVILVGGSTRIPLLQRMVAEYFGRKPLVNIDPDLVVAQGAALQAQSLAVPSRKAPLGKVALKKMAQPGTGEHDIVIDESFEDEVTNIGDRPPLPPPPVARAARKATLPGRAPPPPPVQLKKSDDLPVDDAVFDTPTRSGEEPLEHELTRVAGAVDPLDFQPTRMADASGLLMEIGRHPDDEPEELEEEPSGLMMELGDDAFGGRSDIPAEGTALPQPPLDLASSAPAELRAALDEDVDTVTGAVAVADGLQTPLLLDVTPLSLGVETVDGYCEHIIRRNSAIPAGQTKMFTTARDRQDAVVVRICQGEDRQISGNQLLGEVILDGLRPAARGKVQIAVRFMIDADGTLQVRAQDVGTGQQQQIAIKLIGELAEDEIEQLTKRHEAKLG
ncbi:MAG: Hsp70 family protein [Deltaproteobacteria bacterium]|nr:Hsp70 family protein [Deltaproteobacteria bacterium]MBW2586588.1 Hsp70 family protein [Deltaproteobacteria bacterium]